MKKICKKIVSILVLAAMIISVMPVITPAAESALATLTDAMYVRGRETGAMGGATLQLDAATGDNHRVAFLKFDFSGYTGDLNRIDNMILSVVYKEAATTSGMKVYIMPDDKEYWDSTYTYQMASEAGISVSSCGELIYQTSETMAANTPVKTVDISKAVVSHLKSYPSNKTVCFRLEAVKSGGYVIYGTGDSSKKPSISFDVLTDSEYVAKAANDAEILSGSLIDTDLRLSDIKFADDVNVLWTSSDASVLSDDGKVTLPAVNTDVTLTLKISLKSDETIFATKDFDFTVLAGNGSKVNFFWDFEGENGLADKISGATFSAGAAAYAVPVLHKENGDTVAKVEWLAEDTAFALSTKSVFGSSSSVFSETSNDKYIVIETEFKKDATADGSYTEFRLRENSSNQPSMYGFGWNSIDWTKLVFVVDMHKNTNGKYTSYAYKNDGKEPHKVEISMNQIEDFRITSKTTTPTPNLYIDDMKISTYKDFYAALNGASNAGVVMNIIDSYNALKLAAIPAEYYAASNYDKSIAASALVGKNFTSDVEAFEALKAAIPEQIGATIYYKWDFENGNLEDIMNGVEFMTDHPNFVPGSVVYTTDPADESNGVAKNIIGVGDELERLVFTDKLEADYNSGNGMIKNVVYDIKIKSEGDGSSRIGIDDNANIRKNLISNVVNTNNAWKSYRVVVDVLDKTVTTYQYFNNMWNQTEKTESIEKFDFNRISSMNNNKEKSADVYFDDVEIRAYDAIYEEINEVSEENFETVLAQLEEDMLISVPSAFHSISAEERAEVISEVKSKTYTSDAEFEAALIAALPESNEVVYYNWDFENGTLNDTIKAEPFMMDHPDDTAENRVELAIDPIDASNSVAKVDYAASALERLVFTPDINADFKNNIFGYVTYDFRVYAPETTKISIRISSKPTDHHVYSSELEGGKWHTVRAIADLDSKTVKGYELTDGKWTLVYQESNIEEFDFNRFSIFLGAVEEEQVPVAYFDDFKVTSHVSLYEKVNAATEENIAEVLEYYDSICAIDLTDAYDALSADEKKAFASAIKAKTYADSYEVNKEVILYFTDKDFVVFGHDYVEDKLDWVKLIIAKSDITAESANVVVASYNGNELIDVNFVSYTGSLAGGSDVEVEGLGLDVTDATSVKVMLLNDFEKLTPLAKCEIVK